MVDLFEGGEDVGGGGAVNGYWLLRAIELRLHLEDANNAAEALRDAYEKGIRDALAAIRSVNSGTFKAQARYIAVVEGLLK